MHSTSMQPIEGMRCRESIHPSRQSNSLRFQTHTHTFFEPSLGYGLAGSKEIKYVAVVYEPWDFQKCDFYLILL